MGCFLHEIAHEQQVGNVTCPVVESGGRVVGVRDGMKFLGNLKTQGDTDKDVGIRQRRVVRKSLHSV